MRTQLGRLAVVSGASSGIGFELAKVAAEQGFDLVIAAKSSKVEQAAIALRKLGVAVDAVDVDLSTVAGVNHLVGHVRSKGRGADVLIANAGVDLGHAFLDQELNEALAVIDVNIRGTVALVHAIGKEMRGRGHGRIMITGSIVGLIPGPYHAVYSASKAFLYSFSMALRQELQDDGVSVTCLMPGATDTPIYAKADMVDTAVGQSEKAEPSRVARVGFEAMMRGEGRVVPGLINKALAAASNVIPSRVLTAIHAAATKPVNTGKK